MENKPYILCAAIWFDDGKTYSNQPYNIKSGLVLCGHRHHNIFTQIGGLVGERQQLGIREKEQGFLTSDNRFVGRNEAAKIARDAKQITWTMVDYSIVELYSEDLY